MMREGLMADLTPVIRNEDRWPALRPTGRYGEAAARTLAIRSGLEGLEEKTQKTGKEAATFTT